MHEADKNALYAGEDSRGNFDSTTGVIETNGGEGDNFAA
jgi:hypothetical protein